MTKILLSILMIGIVSATAIGATRAAWSDTETSPDNTFAAGTLNLQIDGKDGEEVTTKYTLTNWKPGDDKMVGGFSVKNSGSVSGKYWFEIKNVVNNENGCTDPEDKALDTTCGATEGELGSKISGYFQENVAPWSHLNPSFTSIDSGVGVPLIPADGGVLAGGEEVPVVLYAKWVSTATDNQAQGDSVSFDLVVHLEQTP